MNPRWSCRTVRTELFESPCEMPSLFTGGNSAAPAIMLRQINTGSQKCPGLRYTIRFFYYTPLQIATSCNKTGKAPYLLPYPNEYPNLFPQPEISR